MSPSLRLLTRRSARVSVGRSLLQLGLRPLRRWPVTAIVLGAASLGLVAVACGGDTVRGGERATSTPVVRGEVGGNFVKLPSGERVRVIQFQDGIPRSANDQVIYKRTDHYSVAEVEVCGGLPFFTAKLSNNGEGFVLSYPLAPEPKLDAGGTLTGDCARGWVGFEMPAGVRATAITYTPYSTPRASMAVTPLALDCDGCS
jgi:hypothetical protein